MLSVFQSTPSSRRATCEWADYPAKVLISIHALLTEGDLDCGDIAAPEGISIHALLTEGDFRHCFVVK